MSFTTIVLVIIMTALPIWGVSRFLRTPLIRKGKFGWYTSAVIYPLFAITFWRLSTDLGLNFSLRTCALVAACYAVVHLLTFIAEGMNPYNNRAYGLAVAFPFWFFVVGIPVSVTADMHASSTSSATTVLMAVATLGTFVPFGVYKLIVWQPIVRKVKKPARSGPRTIS